MKIKELPSWEYLNECFNYDSLTGELWWKERPLKHFAHDGGLNIFNGTYKGTIAGSICNGYKSTRVEGILYTNHRIIWKLITKKDPPNYIDHIDGDTFNNKFTNLRKATHSENQRNRGKQSNNTSGFKGVSYDKKYKKYLSYISYGKKRYSLGYFDTAGEASLAYQEAAKKYHHDFANF